MGTKKLTILLLTWNGEKYIPWLFQSLREQTYKDWNLVILDNGSTDNTVELVKKELANFPCEYEFKMNKENIGFAQGYNKLFRESDSEYLFILNQDVYLFADCLEGLMESAREEKIAAAITPKIMRWDFFPEMKNVQDSFSDEVDSLGIKINKMRQAEDWCQGRKVEDIIGLFSNLKRTRMEIFGVSGAAALFNSAALKAAAFSDGSVFDESYGSYKEDVDLAYRLRSAGFKSFLDLDVNAYHDRSSHKSNKMILNKKRQPQYIKYHSYKNHLMTIYKNEYRQNFMLDFFWILCYEISKFLWLLLFNPGVLKGWKEIWRLRHELKAKREWIKSKRQIDWVAMRKWLNR